MHPCSELFDALWGKINKSVTQSKPKNCYLSTSSSPSSQLHPGTACYVFIKKQNTPKGRHSDLICPMESRKARGDHELWNKYKNPEEHMETSSVEFPVRQEKPALNRVLPLAFPHSFQLHTHTRGSYSQMQQRYRRRAVPLHSPTIRPGQLAVLLPWRTAI